MASARPYPPSAQRVAEARASGHAPRPLLLASTSALLYLLACAAALGTRALTHLQAFLSDATGALAAGDSARAYARLALFLRDGASTLALLLLGMFVVLLAAELFGRGASFARVRARVPFPPVRRDPSALLVWSIGLTLAASFAVLELLPLAPGELAPFASDWLRRIALLALACAVLDVTLARARFFASLWMTRREQLDEQRAAFGAPELKRAQARLRSETRRDEAV
jgi:flagellar biosynthesis protein FlhB